MNKKEHVSISNEEFQKLLESKGWKKMDLARNLNVHPSTIFRWQTEGKIPREVMEAVMSGVPRTRIGNKKSYGIQIHSTEDLVNELEKRGWKVTLVRAERENDPQTR